MLPFSNAAIVFAITLGLVCFGNSAKTQTVIADTVVAPAPIVAVDSMKLYDSLRKKETKRVVLRAAVLPGWGQISNKQAWKLPFVYAAIGIPTGLFIYNIKEYKVYRDAYRILGDTIKTNDSTITPRLLPLVRYPNRVRSNRDQLRQYVDYSALAILIGWGLQIVDAAVFANLRDFDVSDDLSLRIQPKIQPLSNTYGIGLVLKPSNKNKQLKITAR